MMTPPDPLAAHKRVLSYYAARGTLDMLAQKCYAILLLGVLGMLDGSSRIIIENAVYSRQEAADVLGVSLSTLKKLIDAGYLRASRPPGVRRIFIQGASILEMLHSTAVERHA